MAEREKTRRSIPKALRLQLLTESGFRCAAPNCGSIIAIDLHHLEWVSQGGTNAADNLIPLCPNCHALHHRGEIPVTSLIEWKRRINELWRNSANNKIDISFPNELRLKINNRLTLISDRYFIEAALKLDYSDALAFVRCERASHWDDEERTAIVSCPVYEGLPSVEVLDTGTPFISRSEIEGIIVGEKEVIAIFEKLDRLGFINWQSVPILWPPKNKKFDCSPKTRHLYIYHSKIGEISITRLGDKLKELLADIDDSGLRRVARPPSGKMAHTIE